MHFYPFLLLLSLPACAWREEKLPSSPEIPLVFSFFFLDHNTCNWKNNTGRKSTWLAARGPLFCGSPPYLSLLPLTFAEPFFNPLDLLDFNWIRPKINSAIFWTDEISSCVHACVSLVLFLYLTAMGGGGISNMPGPMLFWKSKILTQAPKCLCGSCMIDIQACIVLLSSVYPLFFDIWFGWYGAEWIAPPGPRSMCFVSSCSC